MGQTRKSLKKQKQELLIEENNEQNRKVN